MKDNTATVTKSRWRWKWLPRIIGKMSYSIKLGSWKPPLRTFGKANLNGGVSECGADFGAWVTDVGTECLPILAYGKTSSESSQFLWLRISPLFARVLLLVLEKSRSRIPEHQADHNSIRYFLVSAPCKSYSGPRSHLVSTLQVSFQLVQFTRNAQHKVLSQITWEISAPTRRFNSTISGCGLLGMLGNLLGNLMHG